MYSSFLPRVTLPISNAKSFGFRGLDEEWELSISYDTKGNAVQNCPESLLKGRLSMEPFEFMAYNFHYVFYWNAPEEIASRRSS